MLGFGLGLDWHKSPAHWLLLSKFLRAHRVEDFNSDAWRQVLREQPARAIDRFVREGLLQPATLADALGCAFKVADLKAYLKERQLPVSGRKEALIARLIEADLGAVKRAVGSLTVLQCSDKGRALAESYLEQEAQRRRLVEGQVVAALRRRDFGEAGRLVTMYERQQVFPGRYGLDWNAHDPAVDAAALKSIFCGRPKILSGLTDDQLEQLRVVAGVMYLWGQNEAKEVLPAGFRTGLEMDDMVAARMLLFFYYQQRSLASYRRIGVKKVKVRIANDGRSCDACRELAGRTYTLDEVPELPYEHCTHKMGCRCMVLMAGSE